MQYHRRPKRMSGAFYLNQNNMSIDVQKNETTHWYTTWGYFKAATQALDTSCSKLKQSVKKEVT